MPLNFEMVERTVPAELAGERADRVLAALVPEVSRAEAQRLLERGQVLADGTVLTSKKQSLAEGTVLIITLETQAETAPAPEAIPLDIFYEDEDVLVVNKSRGMVVHPGAGNRTGTLVNALLSHCEGRLFRGSEPDRPGIVHRIDKDTSGLLVCAKTDAAGEALMDQMAVHAITRKYLAIVQGNLKEDEGVCDQPLGRDPKDRMRRAVNGEGARPAITHYRVLERFGDATLVECRLETGRTHQIRVHMAALGHPVLEDPLYGPRKTRRKAAGQYLHACVLGFRHPRTGEYMEFRAPAPPYFEEKLGALRRRQAGRTPGGISD